MIRNYSFNVRAIKDELYSGGIILISAYFLCASMYITLTGDAQRCIFNVFLNVFSKAWIIIMIYLLFFDCIEVILTNSLKILFLSDCFVPV